MSWCRIIKSPRVADAACLVGQEPAAENPGARETGTAAAAAAAEAQAYAQGLAMGREQGRAEAEQACHQETQACQELLQAIDHELGRYHERQERYMLEMALAVAKKIIGASAEQGEAVQQSLRKALARRHEPGDMLTVRLHPEDYNRLAPADNQVLKNFRMQPDPEIGLGGCVMETGLGSIDARLETQLEELAKVLRRQQEAGAGHAALLNAVDSANEIRSEGRVVHIVGTVIESRGPNLAVGERCEILSPTASGGEEAGTWAEVIGFKENRVLLMPLGDRHGIGPGSRVVARGQDFSIMAGSHLLGRVLNGLGQPIDGQGLLAPAADSALVSLHGRPNNPMARRPITTPLFTGVRAIDGFLTAGLGGRMGIFAGSGVGKSVLLGMIARNTAADVNVIALIGERGREVREFVERDLGPEGLRRSVVIAVTSDESPLVRIHGAQLAASVAEHFARQGKDVMFMMDSVTRFAMAHREIGLAIGEPPATKGYTPSTFAALPKLLERSGVFGERGSITGLYTVLVEGDDMDEPVADHVRSILDGHIVLSRSLFSQNHFPAIDILTSISRLAKTVCSREQTEWAGRLRDQLAILREMQDLLNIGAYVRGSNPKVDQALAVVDDIHRFLKQGILEQTKPEEMWVRLAEIAGRPYTPAPAQLPGGHKK